MSDTPLDVWSIRDHQEPERKAFWKHIGRAFKNRDGSINVLLDALPLSHKMQIRAGREEEPTAAA